MTLYVRSLETGEVVDVIEGRDNEDCERIAGERWESNDYSWGYC